MIKFLIKRFIRDSENVSDKKVRESYGVLGGVIGIVCNAFLFLLKLAIGVFMNSIAIMSDAFNNLSDMGSSVVALIGSKLSNMRPDKEHPFGHGRYEYISSLIVSFIIMLVGMELLKTSVGKILHPEEVNFNIAAMIILSVSVLVKVWMFFCNRYMGEKINSSVLKATASDSLNDVVATGAVILTTLIGRFVDFPQLDGIVGTIVALMIVYAGFEIAKDTVDMLLGTPPSPELVSALKSEVMSAEGIVGTHDLIIHDYGPGRSMASIHAEVPDNADIVKMHEVIDAVEKKVFCDMGIHLVIHMDPISVDCERTIALKELVIESVFAADPSFTIHDFRVVDGENSINLIFDIVVPIDTDETELKSKLGLIKDAVRQKDSRCNCVMQIDYGMV